MRQGKNPRGQPPFRPNKCAVCKQEGHWKNECQNQKGPEEQDHTGNANLIMLEDLDNE